MQNQNIDELAVIIAKKKFDPNQVSETPFVEWNGRSEVDCSDIEKLYLSYNFADMADKGTSAHKLKKITDQIILFQRYKKRQNQIARILFSLLIAFIIVLIMFFQQILSSYVFYISIVIFYLFSINYPVLIRRKVRKYRFLNLG